jgi:hypothetical protein
MKNTEAVTISQGNTAAASETTQHGWLNNLALQLLYLVKTEGQTVG